jgi:hypothetical protein
VVLLGVVSDDIVDLCNVLELGEQHTHLLRIDGVYQGCFLASLNQVGVVARAVRKRDQRVEQPPVPIHGTHPIDLLSDLS